MAGKKKGKEKYPLLFATVVAFLTVCTAGVSTFAWFQAEAHVNISSTSTNTTITVNRPENQFEYYAYKGNKTSHTAEATNETIFTDDFISLTSSNVSSETNLESLGFYPGRSFSFCVKVNNLTAGTSVVTFNITKLISNDVTKQSASPQNRYVFGGNNKQVNVGWGINIFSLAIDDPSGYASFVDDDPDTATYTTAHTDKFQFTDSSTGTYASSILEAAGTGSYPDKVMTLNTPLQLATKTAGAGKTSMYIFYRIVFSKADSTLYKEVDSNQAYVVKPPASGNRYFVKYNANTDTSTEGFSSSCYAGLKFALNELSVVVA